MEPKTIVTMLDETEDRRGVIQSISKNAQPSDLFQALQLASNPQPKQILIRMIADLGSEENWSVLSPFLRDKDHRVRGAAADGIARLEAHDAAGAITAALIAENDGSVLAQLSAAAGAVGASSAVSALLDLVINGDVATRRAAAWSLAEIADSSSHSVLLEAVAAEHDSTVLASLKRALARTAPAGE